MVTDQLTRLQYPRTDQDSGCLKKAPFKRSHMGYLAVLGAAIVFGDFGDDMVGIAQPTYYDKMARVLGQKLLVQAGLMQLLSKPNEILWGVDSLNLALFIKIFRDMLKWQQCANGLVEELIQYGIAYRRCRRCRETRMGRGAEETAGNQDVQ